MEYLQSPLALPFVVAILVAVVRRLAPRIDGPYLVLSCAIVCGALLGLVQHYALGTGSTVLGAVLVGAVSGGAAFGGHDLLAGLLSKAGPITIGGGDAQS